MAKKMRKKRNSELFALPLLLVVLSISFCTNREQYDTHTPKKAVKRGYLPAAVAATRKDNILSPFVAGSELMRRVERKDQSMASGDQLVVQERRYTLGVFAVQVQKDARTNAEQADRCD
ncbi:hypothetical protein B0T22DRAFT_30209 [Podospora appendiculata]|uniref:Uncharacterized protein n=1 Tax=Podospora appendiculata TaxID=314037 RepID=A0AAE0XGN7_9PEZI|nr:hypothetical protein B0T22DRAFT_30209 [Podospora appendiculata]